MPVDLALWNESFAQKSIPAWPCPCCGHGRLSVSDNGLKVIEPQYSKDGRAHEAWEPEWITERFVAVMKCGIKSCGELVIVSGETEIVEEEDEDFGRVYASHLCPRSIFPAPPIIVIPKEVPQEISREIRIAFQLYWSDLNASASRVRTSVERMMDDFKVAKTRTDFKTKKKLFRPLASRIDLFKTKKPEHADILDALRNVGNVGTHAEADRQSVLAAFAVYEEALAEIYGKRSKKTKSLSKKLIKGKGKLK